MKVDDETREERMKSQKEAQAKLEEKKKQEKATRLAELEQAKQDAMLKAASRKK